MTIEIITSDALSPLRHGFFSRKGGASSGVYTGLNCGRGSCDQAEAVAINRERVAEAMDVDVSHLVSVHQVHSADVVTLDGPVEGDKPKADAMVTSTPGLALGVLTADCQPVLFADADAGVIGAAHGGWRGTKDGILESTVTAMEALGASRDTTTAVIGPSISQRNYEVGPEFFDELTMDDDQASRFFAGGQGDRMQFDLPGFAMQRLRDFGIGEVHWTRHCTYTEPDMFYSYRRSTHLKEADYGRLISVIRL